MLNVAQRLAVASTDSRLLCLAAPGSGKTRVLTERAARILATHHPKEVLLLTFTRKAAGEMRERLETAVPGKSTRWWMDMQVSTMHSWGLRILRIFHDRLGMVQNFTVRDDVDKEDVVRFAGLELGVMPRPGQKPKAGQVTSFKGLWARDNVRARYHSLLREAQAVDYDMIEALLLDLLRLSKDDPYGPCTWVRDRWRHVLVDEGQDTSAKQQEILDVIRAHNLFVVGDAAQCQPAGTMVQTPTGPRAIETLRDGDRVCGWDRRSAHVYTEVGQRVRVGARPYTGLLTTILTESGRSTTCTDTHKWLVRWGPVDDLHAVYLMRRDMPDIGTCYRIGWCKVLHDVDGNRYAHYKQRARLEKADAYWIVKLTRDRAEASAWESIHSVRYGIPTVLFRPNGVTLYTADTLGLIWLECATRSVEGGEALLADAGRHVDHPLWAPDHAVGRQTVFRTVGANLVEGMMVPVWNGKQGYTWETVTCVNRRWVDDHPVYSLDVETHHSYVADGICTLNSVYGFRGANMRGFLDLGARPGWTTVTLPTNYRSHAAIVAAATACGQAMESPGLVQDAGRTEGFPADEEDAPLDVLPAVHLDELGGIVAADILYAREVRGLAWRDFAVLSPTWAHLEEVVGPALQAAGIPFKVARRGQTLWDAPGARWLVNTLRAAHNADDHLSLYAALTAFSPRVTLEDWARLRAEAAASGTQVLDRFLVWPDAPRNLRNALAMVKSDERWVDGAVDAAAFLVVDAELLHLRTRVEEVRAAVDALLDWVAGAVADGEGSLGAFLDWYAERTVAEIEEEAEEQDEVTLLSCHGGKGLEWRSVHVVGCNEGILPRAAHPGPGLEEERRLFYVALTRGMDRVRLCFTTDRAPSRFIDEALPLWDPVSIYSRRPPSITVSDADLTAAMLEMARNIGVFPGKGPRHDP